VCSPIVYRQNVVSGSEYLKLSKENNRARIQNNRILNVGVKKYIFGSLYFIHIFGGEQKQLKGKMNRSFLLLVGEGGGNRQGIFLFRSGLSYDGKF
jgi:hypothetical protein